MLGYYPLKSAKRELMSQVEPIAKKIEGTPDQQGATSTKRLEIREIMGSKNVREVTLK